MPRFRLLVGTHVHGGRAFTAGDVLSCDEQQARLFRTVFADKFEELVETQQPSTSTPSEPQNKPSMTKSKLNEMNLQQLKQLAEEEEIDISGLSRKSEIVEAIAQALGL